MHQPRPVRKDNGKATASSLKPNPGYATVAFKALTFSFELNFISEIALRQVN